MVEHTPFAPEASQWLRAGIERESFHQLWGAMDCYAKSFAAAMSIDVDEEGVAELATTAGMAFINHYAFCWQSGLLQQRFEMQAQGILEQTLALIGWISSHSGSGLALPSPRLDVLMIALEPGVHLWSTPLSPTRFVVKAFSSTEQERWETERAMTVALAVALSKNPLHFPMYRESRRSFEIKVYPGLVGAHMRKWMRDKYDKVTDDTALFSYVTRGRDATADEQIEAAAQFGELMRSDSGRNQVQIERQVNWMWPRIPTPLFWTTNPPRLVTLEIRGATLADVMTCSDNEEFKDGLYRLSIDVIAGFIAAANAEREAIEKHAPIRKYDYGQRLASQLVALGLSRSVSEVLREQVGTVISAAPRVLVHGDAKPANLIMPWTLGKEDPARYLASELGTLLQDKPGNAPMFAPEVPQSLAVFEGRDDYEIRPGYRPVPCFHAYLYPWLIDLESVCLAPVAHDLVRLLEAIPQGRTSWALRDQATERFEQRMRDVYDRTGRQPPVSEVDASCYDCIFLIYKLDLIIKCRQRGGSYRIGANEYSEAEFRVDVQRLHASNSAFAQSIRGVLQTLDSELRQGESSARRPSGHSA